MKVSDFVKLYPSIQFMPIQANKMPIHKEWQKNKTEYDFTGINHIGIVCGALSGGIEAIDLDLKYDNTGTLGERFRDAIVDSCEGLLEKLVIQKTTSGGFHWIYRCESIQGNLKLARRFATEEEKQKGDKIKVLLETRGEGGYIACYPTPGYELIYNSFDKISTITIEERGILHAIAREFNEVFEEAKPTKKQQLISSGLSSFEDYDQRADVVMLLESHGWKTVGHKGNKILLKRPGDTSARHSGNFDIEKNWFSVFSTSTEFKEETAYRPYAVFCVLECNGDYQEASRKLYNLGYGERAIRNKEEYKIIGSPEVTKDRDFLKDIKPLDSLKNQMEYEYIHGKPRGETTCFKTIDPHFTWLRGEVTVFAGHNNHGKSEIALQLMLAKAKINGWKWAIFSPENLPGSYFYDCLIESYIGKSVDKVFANCMTIEEYRKGMEFVGKHFILVDPEENKDVDSLLAVFEYLLNTEKVDGVVIDPWNSVEHNEGKREDQYLRKQLVKIKTFTTKHNTHFVIVAHPRSIGKFESGEYKIPDQNDLAGGSMWGHKVDNVIVIHRPSYHTSKSAAEVMFISHKIKKQKQVGIPGTVDLIFERSSRRYYEKDNNCPLHTIEVPIKNLPKEDYLSKFNFKEPKYRDTLNNEGADAAPF